MAKPTLASAHHIRQAEGGQKPSDSRSSSVESELLLTGFTSRGLVTVDNRVAEIFDNPSARLLVLLMASSFVNDNGSIASTAIGFYRNQARLVIKIPALTARTTEFIGSVVVEDAKMKAEADSIKQKLNQSPISQEALAHELDHASTILSGSPCGKIQFTSLYRSLPDKGLTRELPAEWKSNLLQTSPSDCELGAASLLSELSAHRHNIQCEPGKAMLASRVHQIVSELSYLEKDERLTNALLEWQVSLTECSLYSHCSGERVLTLATKLCYDAARNSPLV